MLEMALDECEKTAKPQIVDSVGEELKVAKLEAVQRLRNAKAAVSEAQAEADALAKQRDALRAE